MSKRIVLFIVEGLSEQNALYPILTEIITNNNIHFEVTYGDITSNYKEDTSTTILQTLESIVNTFLTKRNFHVDDLLEIVFITDTDGTYIDEKQIKQHEEDKVIYEDNEIFCQEPFKLQVRNVIKSQILDKLSNINDLTIRNIKVDFKTFYMSCNLDHVLYNERNLKDNKAVKAIKFADSYENKEQEFIPFLKQFMININHDYIKSWNEIKKKNNSLLRFSNLWLYLKRFEER